MIIAAGSMPCILAAAGITLLKSERSSQRRVAVRSLASLIAASGLSTATALIPARPGASVGQPTGRPLLHRLRETAEAIGGGRQSQSTKDQARDRDPAQYAFHQDPAPQHQPIPLYRERLGPRNSGRRLAPRGVV